MLAYAGIYGQTLKQQIREIHSSGWRGDCDFKCAHVIILIKSGAKIKFRKPAPAVVRHTHTHNTLYKLFLCDTSDGKQFIIPL